MSHRLLWLLLAALVVLPACRPEPAVPPGTDTPPAATATATPRTSAPSTPTATAPPDSPSPAAPATRGPVEVRLSVVAEGLDVPWDVAFLDERVFVTERDSGRLVELVDGAVRTVQRLQVDATGEGGLLGLAARDGQLYAYLTSASDNRVVRFRPGEQPEPVLTGIPKGRFHNGGRIAFGPDDLLYVTTGDALQPELAQDPGSPAGKILRVEPETGRTEVVSMGHRNVQGLAWTAAGTLYVTEFGPDRNDEVNLIREGGNYGWPHVSGRAGNSRFVDPVVVRQPDEASWSGAVIPVNSAVPQWDGDLLAAALRGKRLWRVRLEDDGAEPPTEQLLVGEHGRLRHVLQAPDGSLWVLTSNRDGRGRPRPGDDRILRLGPP